MSVEIVRVWATDGKLNMTVASDVWDDPAAWGIMLADLAGKIATSLACSKGFVREQILERLREGFDDEWQHMDMNDGG